MLRVISKLVLWALALLTIGLLLLLALRAYDAQRSAPLSVWHTYVPHDLRAADMAKLDWAGYLAAEARLFDEVRAEVSQHLAPEDQVAQNRYWEGSPIHPARFAQDFNRSYLLMPDGPPRGAVVLLHGLTDTPYSLRHVATLYRARGWVVVAPRLPAHGTVPAALSDVDWEDWTAATRLAVREAARRAPGQPLHLVGFSNGGALATQYALDTLADPALARAQRVILIAPMIGITAFARFAGVMGWPAVLPAFANASWLSVVTEFNPFKYNSFPINGARQSSLLTRELQAQINRAATDGSIRAMPPILTLQSVVDFTVSTRAIITALYAQLPANGSELVLVDVNRAAKLSPLLRLNLDNVLDRVMLPPPRSYTTVVLANAARGSSDIVARITPAGSTTEEVVPIGLSYPPDLFSLSHLAIPFPMDDALYGMAPRADAADEFGVNLGALSARGEVGLLVVSLDSLTRASSNPFLPWMLERIGQGIDTPPAPAR